MEIALNLAWLGVTLALLWMWRFRWLPSHRNSRRSLRLEAVALVCVLALLFPVISLTDDLHPEIIAVDSVSGKRNACLMAAASVPRRDLSTHWGTHFIHALLLQSIAGAKLIAVSRPDSPQTVLAPTVSVDTRFGRSPPNLL
jgi:hypothetical protein